MKFNLSIASLCLTLLAAAKADKISEYAVKCGVDNLVVADNCINTQKGTYYYNRPDSTCALEYVCMIPCSTNELPTTSKSLRFFTKGKSYCDMLSNIDECQSDKKYYDYKQCLLMTMRMDELKEIDSAQVENLKNTIQPEPVIKVTTTTASVPTIVKKKSNKSPLKSNVKATQECAAEGEACGGSLYPTAPTCCQEGCRCQKRNNYYSRCVAI
jgi:hypothetical protein